MRLSDIAKKMILVICVSLLVIVAAGAAYYRSLMLLPFALGAFSGATLNVLKVFMLDRAVKKIAGMEKERAGNYARVQHFLRFLLTGAVLVIAALVPFINIWGAAAGVLTYNIAALFMKRFAE
ncbi:MAG: ATP synthase subunit I [Oscillospiraceae bacterium]|nr:ATP synthase subunit I [Oscillospiraceae bacterium]